MKYGYTINNKLMANSNGKLLTTLDTNNPLNLPLNTIRVRTNDGEPPNRPYPMYDSATLVSGTTDVYDVYKEGNNFVDLLAGSTNLIEVIGGNTPTVTNMQWMFTNCTSLSSVSLFDTYNVTSMAFMFRGCHSLVHVPLFDTSKVVNMGSMFDQDCSSLSSVPLFDTSKVTNMHWMFANCTSLTSIPLFDTSKAVSMGGMFSNCLNVQSGALAVYQQASTQPTPPTDYAGCFMNCGINTETGSAELAQIPSDWK